jgi:hypothetical protein
MRDLINIVENFDYGQIVRKIHNAGEIGDLENALALWVEGEMSTAEPHLLRLEHVAENFRSLDSIRLYRGISVFEDEAKNALLRGLHLTHSNKLESWSHSKEAVYDFMEGFDASWIMIRHVFSPNEIYIDLSDFHFKQKPHTLMDGQEEVIVKINSRTFYPPEALRCPNMPVEDDEDDDMMPMERLEGF